MTSLELYRKVRLPSVSCLVIIVVCKDAAYYHSVLQGPTSLHKYNTVLKPILLDIFS